MRVLNRLGLTEGVETLIAHGNRMSVLSNNLANANTIGFKKENFTFWEMLHNTQSNRQRVGKAMLFM